MKYCRRKMRRPVIIGRATMWFDRPDYPTPQRPLAPETVAAGQQLRIP
jgi:hypothetical protein